MRSSDKKVFTTLKDDLQKLERDWEDLLTAKRALSDSRFLREMAHDIKQLNEDSSKAKTTLFSKEAHLIQHILTTPWGAPFVSDKTLLEAAYAYDLQNPLQSDLSHLMDEFTIHSRAFHNQFITLFHAIAEDLEKKAKEEDEQ